MNYRLLSPKYLIVLLTAVAIVVMMVGVSTTVVRAQTVCTPSHVVGPGENLFRLALGAGTSWPVLQQLNGITDPNLIFVGQVICLPGSIVVPTSTSVPPIGPTPVAGAGITLPPPGIFPTIDFNTRSAGPGDVIVITGVNFPRNETVGIFIAPVGAPYPATASGTATSAVDGTLNTNFTIPTDVAGVQLRGSLLSVMVKGRTTGYFGFNFFFNPRP